MFKSKKNILKLEKKIVFKIKKKTKMGKFKIPEGFSDFEICDICGEGGISEENNNQRYNIENYDNIETCENCKEYTFENLSISERYKFLGRSKKQRKWIEIPFKKFLELCKLEDEKDKDFSKIAFEDKIKNIKDNNFEIGNIDPEYILGRLLMVPNKELKEKMSNGLMKAKFNLNKEIEKIKKKRKMLKLLTKN